MSDQQDPFSGWAILELMGHRRLGGMVSEVEFAGGKFVRIDVPGDGDEAVATQLYGASAIYCLTPTTEEMARAVARRNRPEPVHRWELPAPRQATDVDMVTDAYARDGHPLDDDLEDLPV